MTIKIVNADKYTVEELTEAYNQTRVDYMVPMPMNAAKLREYMHVYQVNQGQSVCALEDDEIIGLGMLGVRQHRSWITRLGLVANQRGKGTGQAVMEALLENSDNLGIENNILEVISGNVPAHKLFTKLGFEEVGELLILRRAPAEVPPVTSRVIWMEKAEALGNLRQRRKTPAWTNQSESLTRIKGLQGFHVYLKKGGHGWMTFQRTLFNLSRIMYFTEDGDPVEIMRELLHALHAQFPSLDTHTENIPADDSRLLAFEELGYFEAFRRVEMHRKPNLS